MGQYHTIYNITKKEMVIPHKMGDGAKLLEWGLGGMTTAALAVLLSNSNGRGGGDLTAYDNQGKKHPELQGYIDKVAGRWAGDKIVVQGDYAKKGDKGFLGEKTLDDFTDISNTCVEALLVDEYFRDQALQSEGFLVEKYVKSTAMKIAGIIKNDNKKKIGAK